MSFETCLGSVAPFYNLLFSAVLLLMFIKLFQVTKNPEARKPWMLLFTAFFIYIVEEALTILRQYSIIPVPRVWNGLFEMAMIALFIYVLLSEMERLSNREPHGKRH